MTASWFYCSDFVCITSASFTSHLFADTSILAGIEWAPDDENVLALSNADGTTTVWDMSLEGVCLNLVYSSFYSSLVSVCNQ